jgi:hypothetical protein
LPKDVSRLVDKSSAAPKAADFFTSTIVFDIP